MKRLWCLLCHTRLHKVMEKTSHYVYWWCRVCHREWTTAREV